MVHLIQQLIFWIHQHHYLAILFSFLVAFLESIAIVGLFIPGSTILMMIGSLIGAHILSPTAILIASIAGAFSGDGLSYCLGRRYHRHIRLILPLVHFTNLFNKGERFFIKHGGKSVFLGRFVGPLRSVMPIIAGMMQLKPSRFFTANILSALIWAPTYILLGVIIGKHVISVSPHHTGKMLAEITTVMLLVWIGYWLIRSLILHYIDQANRNCKNGQQYVLFKNTLYSGYASPSNNQEWLALGTLVSSVIFLLTLVLVMLPIDIKLINLPFRDLLLSLHAPLLDGLTICITQLGESSILLPLAALVGLYFMQQRQTRLAWHWLGLLIAVIGTVTLFKQLVYCPRPATLATILGYFKCCFPSAHVSMAVAFWGFLAFVFGQQSSELKHRHYLEAAVSLIVISVAFSRLYLDLHWFADVISGLFLGLSCLSATILSYRRYVQPPQSLALKPLAILVIAGFIILAGLFLQRHFAKQYHRLQPAKHLFITNNLT